MRRKFRRLKRNYVAAQHKRVHKLKLLGRHPFTVPVITVLLLIALSWTAYDLLNTHDAPVSNAYVVVISHDHVQQTVPSREPTVGALLHKLNIRINEGDVVEPDVDTPINQDDFRINVYRAVPVEVVDGTHHIYTFSAATTSRSIARQAGLNTYAEDGLATQPVQNFVSDQAVGEQVVIHRSFPITLNLYGTPVATRTHAQTVAELLQEKGITLSNGATVVPSLDSPIAAKSKVYILRKGTKLLTVRKPIAMPVHTIEDGSLTIGTSAVRQHGSSGEKAITYEIDKHGHKTLIQTVIIQAPVTQIVARGTNLGGIKDDMRLAGISAGNYSYVDYIFTHESHWNPAAVNPSGCAGLGQACPGSKLAAVCPNWQSDPICQIKFFNGYALRAYGSWAAAYSHKAATGWW